MNVVRDHMRQFLVGSSSVYYIHNTHTHTYTVYHEYHIPLLSESNTQ